ncbi:class I SAM-dependent methyltransferase [Anaerobacillus sp. CMMVII]|uniref:class I SAM-dependent methyltransferase n=1 Tax=Anaerobacillus sp. CMMVII TaxID=2755588 RepID=UPI0021B74176|nr:class I SAM-dependent methyltransferase [Anaerobacillus sp. CMMVII]MCT8139768.1 class I SAM-dependent methyltransferase [Anaerobacillus sp. CMMVII]
MKKMEGEDFDHLVRFFDGMATTNWLSSVHEQLKEATGGWKEKRVLDVGCGTGRFLLRGANEANHVTGIDLSSEMIKASNQIFLDQDLADKATFVVGDAYHLPFEDREFDIAVSTCVLFLLPEPEIAMDEMIRVINKNGTIAMLNPSLKMNQAKAAQYCKLKGLTGFEERTLMQWSKISTSRHTFSTQQLIDFLKGKGAREVDNLKVLDGLAIITIAKF